MLPEPPARGSSAHVGAATALVRIVETVLPPEEILISRFTLIVLAVGLAFLSPLAGRAAAQEQESVPASAEASLYNANLYFSMGDYEVAQYFFREALRAEPNNVEALIGHGRALANRYNYALAIESFRSALAVDSAQVMAYVYLALAYQSQYLSDPERYAGNLPEALTVLETAERVAPGNTQVLNTRGVILFQMEAFAEARAALEQAVTAAQNDASITSRMESVIHVNLGKTYRDLGESALALSSFRRAVVLDPASSTAHSSLGNALFQAGDCDAAEFELRQAASIDPGSLSAVADLGITLFECGKVTESVPWFEHALTLDGSLFLPPLYTYLARGLIELGRYEDAVFRASQAVELPPFTADGRYWYGRALCARGAVGDLAGAVEQFRKALEIDPAHEPSTRGVNAGCAI